MTITVFNSMQKILFSMLFLKYFILSKPSDNTKCLYLLEKKLIQLNLRNIYYKFVSVFILRNE